MGASGLNHQGPKFTYPAHESLASNLLVVINSDQEAALATTGDRPVGFTQELFASGAQATIFSCNGEARIKAAATWTSGQYLKMAASGELTPESSPTVPTAYTVAMAVEDATAAHSAYAVIFL